MHAVEGNDGPLILTSIGKLDQYIACVVCHIAQTGLEDSIPIVRHRHEVCDEPGNGSPATAADETDVPDTLLSV